MNFQTSPASIIILTFTTIISLYTMYLNQGLFFRWMLNPYRVINNKEWYRTITSGFIHANIPHLLFNMVTLFFFAGQLERIIGTFDFLIIYMISLILSDIPTILSNKENPDYNAVGASGAIAGILFAFILYNPFSKIMIFPIPIPIPAVLFAVLYLVYSQYSAKKGGDNTNHSAHFWGALSGLIIAIILDPGVISRLINKF